jgi:predicted ATPase/DNA-binding SARP family transcriptional activator
VEYRVLGPLEVRKGDEPLALGGSKQRALLALLLLNANRVVSRDRLIDGLWGEEPPDTAVTTIQVYVSRLRKLLPEGALVTRPPGYVLEVEPDELDLERFERLRASGLAEDALALWSGPALAEFSEPFARVEAARLEDLRLATLEERIEAELARGRNVDVARELEALIAEHPHREPFRAQLMRALYRSGRQAEALEAYRDARSALDELGLEPGEELRELERMILRHDAALTVPRTRASLPEWPTTFVGRADEVAEVHEELSNGTRLLTLVGPGGVGKTRLAVAAAEGLGDAFVDGAFFVSLADAREAAAVRPAIAAVLDVRAGESLEAFLGAHEVLLVLDNFEQLVEDGGVVVAELLAEAPRAKLLVTSREPLRVRGEHVYAVSPLPAGDAVDLFVTRARDADNAFRLSHENSDSVAEVCNRLDGLPLALELAAAHIRLLSPEAMLSRLRKRLEFLAKGPRDAPARQRTMRATIEWSYGLLDPRERELFASLACFAGGCTIEAAVAVCDAAVETLEALVDKSLLYRDGGRLRMLEAVRDFAADELEASSAADALSERHASFFTELVERAHAERYEREEEWRASLGLDSDNVYVALAWLHEHNAEEFLRLTGALGYYGDRRIHALRPQLEDALAHAKPQPAIRARALSTAASLANQGGDRDVAVAYAQEAIELWRELGDAANETLTLITLAGVHRSAGRDKLMRAAMEEALQVGERSGDVHAAIRARLALCQVLVAENDGDRTEKLAQEIRDAGIGADALPKRHALHYLADAALIREEFDLALTRYVTAAQANWSVDNRNQTCFELQGVAMAAAGRGASRAALQLFAASDRMLASLGYKFSPKNFWRTWIARRVAQARDDLGGEADDAWREGEALSLEQAVELAQSL